MCNWELGLSVWEKGTAWMNKVKWKCYLHGFVLEVSIWTPDVIYLKV